jgi:hypothetical protein
MASVWQLFRRPSRARAAEDAACPSTMRPAPFHAYACARSRTCSFACSVAFNKGPALVQNFGVAPRWHLLLLACWYFARSLCLPCSRSPQLCLQVASCLPAPSFTGTMTAGRGTASAASCALTSTWGRLAQFQAFCAASSLTNHWPAAARLR